MSFLARLKQWKKDKPTPVLALPYFLFTSLFTRGEAKESFLKMLSDLLWTGLFSLALTMLYPLIFTTQALSWATILTSLSSETVLGALSIAAYLNFFTMLTSFIEWLLLPPPSVVIAREQDTNILLSIVKFLFFIAVLCFLTSPLAYFIQAEYAVICFYCWSVLLYMTNAHYFPTQLELMILIPIFLISTLIAKLPYSVTIPLYRTGAPWLWAVVDLYHSHLSLPVMMLYYTGATMFENILKSIATSLMHLLNAVWTLVSKTFILVYSFFQNFFADQGHSARKQATFASPSQAQEDSIKRAPQDSTGVYTLETPEPRAQRTPAPSPTGSWIPPAPSPTGSWMMGAITPFPSLEDHGPIDFENFVPSGP